MNRCFSLTSPGASPQAVLRTIEPGDLEDLRRWKNANKQAFFFKGEIMEAQQKAWFEGYLARPSDYMFMVEADGARAGCMGFRVEGGEADCYNIIGAPGSSGKGILRAAMTLMCSYILKEHAPLAGCRVLKTNPAVGWYKKCGYRVAGESGDHYKLELDPAVFRPVAFRETAPWDAPAAGPEFYPVAIDLAGLKPGVPNYRRVDADVELVVIPEAGGLRIARDLCPHMGAPLRDGVYRAADRTLQCPWHGYRFSTEGGEMTENPNEAPFAPLRGAWPSCKPEKRPNYRIQLFSYEIKDGRAFVRRA